MPCIETTHARSLVFFFFSEPHPFICIVHYHLPYKWTTHSLSIDFILHDRDERETDAPGWLHSPRSYPSYRRQQQVRPLPKSTQSPPLANLASLHQASQCGSSQHGWMQMYSAAPVYTYHAYIYNSYNHNNNPRSAVT